jgi:hypothetical protein
MGSLYVKGNKLWIRYKDESGKWVGAPTQCRPDEKARARRHLVKVESTIQALKDARKAVDLPPGAPLTVTAYCGKWLADRKRLGIKSLQDDISRMRLHILPRIGTLLMQEVRPRHLREMVLQLREAGKLAPRTLCNVYHLSARTAACSMP